MILKLKSIIAFETRKYTSSKIITSGPVKHQSIAYCFFEIFVLAHYEFVRTGKTVIYVFYTRKLEIFTGKVLRKRQEAWK